MLKRRNGNSSSNENNQDTFDGLVTFPEFITLSGNDEDSESENTRAQHHVHEFQGSTMLAEQGEERHNHRFAGVSGQAIGEDECHYHRIETNTDFFDHFHIISVKTGPAITVGEGKHVHFAEGLTTINDNHRHKFNFATLIQSPLTT